MIQENIFTYLRVRGSIDFKDDPFNEIDAMIFSILSYIDFSDFYYEGISINEVYLALVRNDNANSDDEEKTKQRNKELIYLMTQSKRFSQVKFYHYCDQTSYEDIIQFSGIHIEYTKNHYFIAFRGTDNSLTGWKENWMMIYMTSVPAQLSAVDYLNSTIDCSFKGHFKKYIIGGHSKGGNLALFGALNCQNRTVEKINEFYLFDSPGLKESFHYTERYNKIKKKIHAFTPEFSIIAMTFEYAELGHMVASFEEGLNQHYGENWIVDGNHFKEAVYRNEESIRIEKIFKKWLERIPNDQREIFVESLFIVLEKANIVTMTDFSNMNFRNIFAIMKAMTALSKEHRILIIKILSLLAAITGKSMLKHMEEKNNAKTRNKST